jgi:NAD+ kinase
MTIAVYARNVNDKVLAALEVIWHQLNHFEVDVLLFGTLYHALKQKKTDLGQAQVFSSSADLADKADFLFSIGGDGTILDTLSLVKQSSIPVLGINTGRLGFLSSVLPDAVPQAVESLVKGHYSLDKRAMLRLETDKNIFGDVPFALNELTIHKKDSSSMIIIHTYLNGEYLNSYWADGLIIATPTGSTGYSLSCGGPVIAPYSGNFVITPIAPHNLNVRPIVVSDKNVISIEVEGRNPYFLASLDSRSVTIDSSVQLAVRREDFNFSLVRFDNDNFLQTLRNKLNWGLDTRNW